MKTVLMLVVIFAIIIGKVVVIGHNADLIEEAYERQMRYLKDWDKYVTETPKAPNEIALEFKGKLKVTEAFTILQTWRRRIENDTKKHMYFVELPIAGEIYHFRMKKDFYNRDQIYITSIHQGLDGMKYEKVFEALKGIDQKKAAEYILEASEAYIDDPRSSTEWEKKYPFLKNYVPVTGKKKSISMSLREILNEIMVVGQVAEAASPPKDDFERWMETSKREEKTVRDTLNKQWKLGVDNVINKRKLKMQRFDYDRLFYLIEDYSAPSMTKTEAKAGLERYFQPVRVTAGNNVSPLSDQVYNDLKNAREQAIDSSRNQFFKLIRPAPKGRVPGADRVFRQNMHRIASNTNNELDPVRVWPEHFNTYFTMYKEGGTQLGRFDMFFNKGIRDYSKVQK